MVRNLYPPLSENEQPTLADLPRGEVGRIARLADTFPHYERQRLNDIGAVPGTEVTVDNAAALGGLRAYRLRGTVIGLRRDQANGIVLEPAN